MVRIFRTALLLLALGWSSFAAAAVDITFHSFNGSVLAGRYPHTFVSMEGTLEDGTPVKENFGFSAKRASLAVLNGPVEHMILVEEEKWLRKTNRHFTLSMTDEQYRKVSALVEAWRNAPGKYYDLETRNCIHFVGEIAKIMGLKVNYPDKLLRKPKSWLNYITTLNPQLG
ncbi:hypothetical protein [Qipengyuania huizhouensis]|jgi:hypothetical protein|uniref:hypothetical protein n=1 Tax=Qipengyuania huizhouensis TaxID=2867245 RepID=UPI0018097855|nr:hypothetical protein [Qipengyuania huizhouensis]MBA4764690.1 hypothetical protein [Erythrobacter sp.]MBX7460344.1 hypothetical protein [Qipengyuania huizhouensis]